MDYKIVFAANLKNLMKQGNLSQSELARQTGIPQQTISRYLLCRHEVTVENLCKIADYFSEDLDVLLGRREY